MDIEITLKLSEVTAAALRQVAETEDISIGQIIRDAIRRDLSRREQAKTPIRADERLVAPLRALLADDFAYAENWADLSRRLLQKGYRLAESGGGLILINHHNGQRLCKASELGHSYAQLTRKFDTAFPGHAHKMLPHSPRRFPQPQHPR
jgi:hypothetical protein